MKKSAYDIIKENEHKMDTFELIAWNALCSDGAPENELLKFATKIQNKEE